MGNNSDFLDPLLSPTFQDDGTDKTRRANINLVGFTITDDPTNDATVVTATGGGGGGGSIAEPDLAALRAVSSLTDGETAVVASPVGTWVYSASTGAGFADDGLTIVKPTSISGGADGRWYNVNSSPVLPTIAALRLAVSGKQPSIQVQNYSTVADGGGGTFDYDSTDTTTADNIGTVVVAGTRRYKRRFSGAHDVRWYGAVTSAAVLHNGNGPDVAKAAINKAAVLAMGNALDAQGGGVGLIPAGSYAWVVGNTCMQSTTWTNVTIEGDSPETTWLFDPEVPAAVPVDGLGGAFFWMVGATKCAVRKMTWEGSATFFDQVPTGIARTDKKGIYWASPSTDCVTENMAFRYIEGETWFVDGSLANPATRNVMRNCTWWYCLVNMINLASGGLAAVDCGAENCSGEGSGQSTAQMGGARWFLKNIYSTGPVANQLSATQLLILNSGYDFLVENFWVDGFDLRLSTVDVVAIGYAGGNIRGTVRGLKVTNCLISTDNASTNAIINVRAMTDFGGVFGPINIAGLILDGVEVTGCGGVAGVGGKVRALQFIGPNGMDCTVHNLKVRNGPGGSVSQGVFVRSDVEAANKITLHRSIDIHEDVSSDAQYDTEPLADYLKKARLVAVTTEDKIAELQALVIAKGFARTTFFPTDITSAGLDGWYDASIGIQLGTQPRASGTSPPVITISGALSQPVGLQIDITTGGARGTALFRWSLNNGTTWQASGVATAASVTLGTSEIVVAFPVGTYNADNLYDATVQTWADLGPNGRNLGTPFLDKMKEPKFMVNRQNGLPGLVTNGIDHYMNVAYARPKPSFVYIVQKANTSAASGTVCDGLSANQTRFYRTGATQMTITAGSLVGDKLDLPAATPEAFHIWRLKWNGATSYGKQDAATLAAGATGAADAAAGFSFGAYNNLSDFYAGTYCEIILLDNEPSVSDDALMFAALQAKYAL